ncbi:MAG: NAD-dependent DNA ligase LigA [Lachnospiraceae bacterium]|jgi:DNA ligase (NAD+)|nr:NAD-dependent DNA ligase LigA [Lachnospiraceae bacterium]
MSADRIRMKELIQKLDEAARAYYQESREIMSNLEYDSLYDELVSLEEQTGIVLAGSPTKKVGYEIVSELPKERHSEPRLSLDKTKEVTVLEEFLKEQEGVLSWKLDGLTIVLFYENGELVKALTRGNGEIGEVVTPNARTFVNLPLQIPYKGNLSVRGEAVIHYSDFKRLNEEIENAEARYKNPRNLCSGSVRQLNTEITAKRSVNFCAYELLTADEVEFHNARMEQLAFLTEQGFEVVEHELVTAETVAESVAGFSERILNYDIPSDGLVLTYNDIDYGISLGRTSKFPRHSLAFKWQDETAETILREIEWSASRTGLINPVAIFDPIELEGTTVSRASVHNVSIMESLKLGIGDRIQVYKANMIIPQIAENLTESGSCQPPESCPVCGGQTEVRQENDVRVLYCINPDCMAKKMKGLSLFVSRDAMDIEGLSEATIEKLMERNLLHDLADLFRLKEHGEVITEMEGFGERSYQKLCEAIEKARHTTLVRLLYSLGIPGVGLAGAKLLSRHFSGDIHRIMEAEAEELTEIDGIGPILAEGVVTFFRSPKNRQTIEDLLREVELEQEVQEEEQPLSGKVFVITGSLVQFENRNALKEYIERRGGKVTGSVSNKTSYLINNDNTSSSSKNKKAAELGIPILTEEEFLKLEAKQDAVPEEVSDEE